MPMFLRQLPLIGCLFVLPALAGDTGNTAAKEAAPLAGWPQWRGPLANGVAPDADPPLLWSETNHIRWKLIVPGKGHSTPIVSGDRVYLTTAVPVGPAQPPVYDNAPGVHDSVPVTHRHQFLVLAVNRRDGKIVWTKSLRRAD